MKREKGLPKTNTKTPMPECKPPKSMKLWVVGKFIMEAEEGRAWEIMGVYDSEEKAIDNCKSAECFIGPLILNDPSYLEQKEWKGAYYPLSSES